MDSYLTEEQDAFGHALLDHLRGRGGVEIIERKDGYILLSSTSMEGYFRPYAEWPEHERQAARYVRGRALDVGCGAGRFLLHLQEQGVECVGIDVSPRAVEVCRQRGAQHVLELSLTEVGPALGEFGTVVLMGNNFGLFGSMPRARRLLKRLHRITTEQGRIIAEASDPYRTEDPFHLAYHEENRRRGRMGGQLRLRVRYKKYRTPWFDYLFVSPEEMEAIIEATGWRLARVIGSEGPVYVAVLEKE
jgi:SAM-dependent methyltransferase